MNRNIFLLLGLIVLASVYSCNKPGSGIPNITIDADLKAAFYYKPGTYWIYRDSITGRVDSFAVRSTETGNNNVAGNYTIDGISIYITEYNNKSLTDTSFWIMSLAKNYIELWWWKDRYGLEYFDFLPAFNYPFSSAPLTSYDGDSGSDNGGGVLNIFPTYSLQNNNFTNVEEIFHSYTFMSVVEYYDVIYANNEEGLIKININDHKNNIHFAWELQRWNIVK